MQKQLPPTVDEYITGFPPAVQTLLQQVRSAVRKAVPGTTEGISYGIPTIYLDGRHLVYFAAFKNHIGFYATPSGHEAFDKELSVYKQGKGSVQFPLGKPLPLDLIARITFHRAGVAAAKPTKKAVRKAAL